jgi:hypothetical protein
MTYPKTTKIKAMIAGEEMIRIISFNTSGNVSTLSKTT